jgi:HEPN domain-containing protein
MINIEKQINYWIKSAELDFNTASDIFKSGKNYHFCLFICHLVIEKLLKAIIVKATSDFPPKTHNLLRLAELGKLELNNDKLTLLQELTLYQIDTRYPDEKFSLYKTATKEFTEIRYNKVFEIKDWLLKCLKN